MTTFIKKKTIGLNIIILKYIRKMSLIKCVCYDNIAVYLYWLLV